MSCAIRVPQRALRAPVYPRSNMTATRYGGFYAVVAKLVNALGLDPGDCRFESDRPHSRHQNGGNCSPGAGAGGATGCRYRSRFPSAA